MPTKVNLKRKGKEGGTVLAGLVGWTIRGKWGCTTHWGQEGVYLESRTFPWACRNSPVLWLKLTGNCDHPVQAGLPEPWYLEYKI